MDPRPSVHISDNFDYGLTTDGGTTEFERLANVIKHPSCKEVASVSEVQGSRTGQHWDLLFLR